MMNKMNKQIVKALSVGIAASMVLQPVAVFAEGNEGDTKGKSGATEDNAQADSQQVTEAKGAANDFVDSVGDTQSEIPFAIADVDDTVNAPASVADVTVTDPASVVLRDQASDSEQKMVQSVDATWNGEDGVKANTDGVLTDKDDDGKTVNDVIDGVVGDLKDITDGDITDEKPDLQQDAAKLQKDVNDLAESGKTLDGAVGHVDSLYNQANELVHGTDTKDGIEDVLDQKSAEIDTYNSEISSATTVEAVNAAYGKALQAQSEAQSAYNTAKKDFAELERQFGIAKAAADGLAIAYQNQFNNVVADDEDKKGDLAVAKKDLVDAQNIAKELAQKAAAAKQAADDREAELAEAVENLEMYGNIIALQNEIAECDNEADKAALVQNYIQLLITSYVSSIEGELDTENPFSSVTLTPTYGEAVTYSVVKYTDKNGVEHTDKFVVNRDSETGAITSISTITAELSQEDDTSIVITPGVDARVAGYAKFDQSGNEIGFVAATDNSVKTIGEGDDAVTYIVGDQIGTTSTLTPVGSGNVTYKKVANSENEVWSTQTVSYTNDSVVKSATKDKGNKAFNEAKKYVKDEKLENATVTLTYTSYGQKHSVVIPNIDDANWGLTKKQCEDIKKANNVTYQVSVPVLDYSKPNYSDVDEGVVVKNIETTYEVWTTTTENKTHETYHVMTADWAWYYAKLFCIENNIPYIPNQNAFIHYDHYGCAYVTVSYVKETSNKTGSITIVTSSSQYSADSGYTAVEARQQQNPVYGKKDVITTSNDGSYSLIEADLESKKTEYSNTETKRQAAEKAIAEYDRLVKSAENAEKAVVIAQNKCDELETKIKALSRKAEEGSNFPSIDAKELSILEGKLAKAKEELEELEKKLDEINQKVIIAGENRDRRIEELNDVDDDDTLSTGGGDDTTFIPGSSVVAPRANALVADDGAAVLGEVRRTATKNSVRKASTSEDTTVAGNADEVKAAPAAEENKTPKAPKAETQIADNETALAATPELEENAFSFWWLLILAAIAGVSVEEYARRKSNKAKAEAKNNINE